MNDSILSKYKRGITEPTLPQAVAIADYFDVSLDWLAGREGYARDAHRGGPPALTPDERGLVDSYRLMDGEQRGRFSTMAGTFVMASEKDGPGDRADVGRDRANVIA